MCIYIRRKTIRGRGRKSVASIRESRAWDVAQKHLRCSAPKPKISVWQYDHPADSPTDSMTQASGRRLTSRSSGNVLKIVYARNALSWHASRWTSGSRRGSAAASLTGNRSHWNGPEVAACPLHNNDTRKRRESGTVSLRPAVKYSQRGRITSITWRNDTTGPFRKEPARSILGTASFSLFASSTLLVSSCCLTGSVPMRTIGGQ